MPVVINEFEVVPAQPAAEGGAAAAPEKPASAAGPTARDIERVIQRAHDRATRLRAH